MYVLKDHIVLLMFLWIPFATNLFVSKLKIFCTPTIWKEIPHRKEKKVKRMTSTMHHWASKSILTVQMETKSKWKNGKRKILEKACENKAKLLGGKAITLLFLLKTGNVQNIRHVNSYTKLVEVFKAKSLIFNKGFSKTLWVNA